MGVWGSWQYKYTGHDSWWKRHSLMIFLTVLMVIQTVWALYCYYLTFLWYEAQKGDKPSLWMQALIFLNAVYFTSIVADTYGYWLQVLSKKFFFEEGSGEGEQEGSGEGEQRMSGK